MASQGQLQWGPLQSTVEVVAFVAITGMSWFNCVELLITIFLSFQRWSGRYFYALVAATCGTLIFSLFVFLQTWAPQLNAYAVTATINTAWMFMVTGQSLVLWSRLHLVSRNRWILRGILYMIVVNAIILHIPNSAFTLLAVVHGHGQIDPTYKPFDVYEKISVAVFTAQEIIISSTYLWQTTRILREGELVQKKSNRRGIQMLFLANIVIIAVDIVTISLEMSALWGVWCSFKGFGYSVKLKIEFAILNQLRESVQGGGSSSGTGAYGGQKSDRDITLSSRIRNRGDKGAKPSTFGKEWQELEDGKDITKTTEIQVTHAEPKYGVPKAGLPKRMSSVTRINGDHHPPSQSSSEIDFATKGL